MANEDTKFPARSTLTSYVRVESMLKNFLDVVPYCADHEDVWSPELATILHEACSQFDSLWKHEVRVKNSNLTNHQLDMRNYFGFMGALVAPLWVFFWSEEGVIIQPFGKWYGLESYKPADYMHSRPDWWQAYNDVKHDRLMKIKEAKLKHAVNAIAALFLTIIYCRGCFNEMVHQGWFSLPEPEIGLRPGSLSSRVFAPHPRPPSLEKDSFQDQIVVESELFSHPVGWCEQVMPEWNIWTGGGSQRFVDRFNQLQYELREQLKNKDKPEPADK